jgi:hypothetical protein
MPFNITLSLKWDRGIKKLGIPWKNGRVFTVDLAAWRAIISLVYRTAIVKGGDEQKEELIKEILPQVNSKDAEKIISNLEKKYSKK